MAFSTHLCWRLYDQQLTCLGFPQSAMSSPLDWSRLLLSEYGVKVLACDQGADRVQCRFTWCGTVFILFCETLCDAVWIETETVTNAAELARLSEMLNKHTQVMK